MMDCWTAFAHRGDPNHRGRPVRAWLHGGSGPELGLDADAIVPTQFAADHRCDFWDRVG
jgi:para-nitrobenzyl esterase